MICLWFFLEKNLASHYEHLKVEPNLFLYYPNIIKDFFTPWTIEVARIN